MALPEQFFVDTSKRMNDAKSEFFCQIKIPSNMTRYTKANMRNFN